MFCFIVVLLCSTCSWAERESSETLFSNSWAVEIKGGHLEADKIAERHGFINRGQVGSLANVYHFVHTSSPPRVRRNVDEVHPKHFHLKSENQVGYVEQQKIKARHKRGYSANAMWQAQWYLHRSNSHDMNIERAWEQNVTGRGVVISILDDGIEYTHPDLHNNYDSLASYDFNDHDNDPIPRYDPTNENKHGTRCAGEVAAKVDGQCGVGAAYNSKVGGVRMLDGDVTDVVEASSLSLNPQHIHIYSSSWGPNDDGSTVDGPGKLASKAFKDGVQFGRNGLGSIFVWAAGNGGRYADSCNCDGYAVSPLTISVGSASEHDKKPWYLEKCSSTLTSTYSSGDISEKQIVTTDLHHLCTSRHTGTSASAPLAAGMMALALEANVNLTWRDMQYLMVYASNPQYPQDSHWHLNGAGLQVSHWYGFGILDGAALVNRARSWITVPPRHNCTYNMTSSVKESPLTVHIEATDCDLAYLEHVQVVTSIRMQKGTRKDISIFLTSPASTKSVLLPYRSRDRHKDGFHLWPFMTVHSWGEQPQGTWTFSILVASGASVKLEALELILFGTLLIPTSVGAIPAQCHPNCVSGCAMEGPQFCDMCRDYQVADTFECVEHCPPGTYKHNKMCFSCPHLCIECKNSTICLHCHPESFLLPDKSCSVHCSEGTYPTPNNTCASCHQSCLSCAGPRDMECISCHPQFILHEGVCKIREPTSCPDGQYFDHRAHECRLCHKSCLSCSGKESTQCTACREGYTTNINGQCIVFQSLRSCYSGQYYDVLTLKCVACPANCANCSDSQACTSCHPGEYLTSGGTCVEHCPLGTIRDDEGLVCLSVDCHQSCSTCFGPEANHCSSCHKGFFLLNNSCKEYCPAHFYRVNGTCVPCHSDCKSCVGPSVDQCSSCYPGDLLTGTRCIQECPSGTYGVANGTCLPCTNACSSCTSQGGCTQCRSGYFLLSGTVNECVSRCPSGYFQSLSSCEPCRANCIVCSSLSSCQSCSPGYVYYAPSGSCQLSCPDDYYVSSSRQCVQCHLPCSTCIDSPLNCSSCSAGMAMDKVSAVCRHCCNPDTTVSQCCDCSKDNKFCHWNNKSSYDVVIPTPPVVTHSFSTAVVVTISLLVLICFVSTVIVVIYWIRKLKFLNSKKKYQKVPSQEHDDNSDFDPELEATPPVIIF